MSYKLRLPARPLSREAYERELARIIEEFQRRVARSEVRGKLRAIVNGVALADADPPSYRDLWDKYGVALARNERHLAGRLLLLVKRGQLEVVGHRIRYGAALYRAISVQRKGCACDRVGERTAGCTRRGACRRQLHRSTCGVV